jgi:hypothetical protein
MAGHAEAQVSDEEFLSFYIVSSDPGEHAERIRGLDVGRVGSGVTAGPARMPPSTAKREPWQGQSQVCSAAFQATWQPRWVQRVETALSVPSWWR